MITEIKNYAQSQAQPTEASKTQTYRHSIISGWPMKLVHFKLKLTLLKIAVTCYKNPFDWFRALRYLVALRRRFLGNYRLQKMAYVNGEYFMSLYTPGWDTDIYKQFIASQLHDFKPLDRGFANRFNTVFLSITKKCALQCEHCYEWEHLNKKDTLSDVDLIKIVGKLQEQGVSQIQLLGGEPLLQMETMIKLLAAANTQRTNFWIVTSGFKLTNVNAKRLKKAGLKGVIVSLDHHRPEAHNAFRHFKDAYYWVEQALANAKSEGLVTALSLCATKTFISEANLLEYMLLAKEFEVSFVQLLEPKAVGHYAQKEVSLDKAHIAILEDFFLKMNFGPNHKDMPILSYHGYYQRRQGCFSAGQKGMYIDSDGDMNACPFCHKKTGKVLDVNYENHLEILKAEGCPTYPST
ncbi:radical SAM/SPASM domain-containing protein [Mangrovimonas sp. YM274]|uniref:radical SAM/SPASM domain-containing protein n=1 Tax=Mangrovimonas sp. YM274 TaxID=3070660 RepID=UPI0027DD9AF2|nr:radical SAM protein [Mangrovimonas sp. YM274]WMI67321.1 radical SAM protein [Mangrovimonas sp. YM274]